MPDASQHETPARMKPELSWLASQSSVSLMHPRRLASAENAESSTKISNSEPALPATTMSKYAKKLAAIAAAWPSDPFRPNMQLKRLLDALAHHPRLTPRAVQAARVLLDDGVQHRFPLSAKTLQPASMPKHYQRLVQGYERSAQGIRRPWWQVFFGIWR